MDFRGLSHFQLPAFRFLHTSGNLQGAWVRQLRDGHPGPGAISWLEGRRSALRLPVVLQRLHAVQRSAQGEGLQASFVQLHLKFSLLQLFLLACEIRSGGRAIRFQLGFGSFQRLFGVHNF